MKKILICAVPFSDNLGDGVIAHSLEHIVRLKYPNSRIEFLDIAGRREFVPGKLRDGKMFAMFRKSPPSFKAAAVLLHCARSFYSKWRSDWKAAIERSDLIIVGGGQLFCDVALNFPMKLFLLGTLLRHKETIVLSVGVSARWSKLGRFLIEQFLAMARPRFMAARDDDSADNLRRMLGHRKIHTAIIHDPALVSGSELADLYRTCDALIIPSRWEGFGLVAIEAMARKKAVFASKVGGLADIVRHKETGWLFELEEIDGMLIDIDAFPDDLLRRMGERGREVFEREFTANRMNNEIVKVYTSVWAQ